MTKCFRELSGLDDATIETYENDWDFYTTRLTLPASSLIEIEKQMIRLQKIVPNIGCYGEFSINLKHKYPVTIKE